MKKNSKLQKLKLNKEVISKLEFKQIIGGNMIYTYYAGECGHTQDHGCALRTLTRK